MTPDTRCPEHPDCAGFAECICPPECYERDPRYDSVSGTYTLAKED